MSNQKEHLKKGILPNLKYDLPAGLVVFLVAVPLCLGIGLASQVKDLDPSLNTPLFAGIIAGIIGGLIIPLFSRSPLSVSGPAAGLIAIVLVAVQDLGSFDVFILAVFLSGLIQIVLGLIKAGTLAYFFPNSVIKGMLAAIGLILILKQIPHALGYDVDFEGEMSFFQADGANTFSEIFNAFSHISVGAMSISIASIILLVIWSRVDFLKKITWLPGALIVVVFGAVVNYIFSSAAPGLELTNTEEVKHLVSLPEFNSVEAFLGEFRLPDWSAIGNPTVWTTALTLAVVASMESLLSVEAVDRIDPFRRESPLNRELIAQGVGNTVSGLIGGLPITAVIVRSSANINSGGRTRTSAVFHGILLLASVMFFASILNLIPLASLAGILILIGYKLASPQLFKKMYKLGWDQFIPFVTTIGAVLVTNLLTGIIIGLIVGVFFVLKTNYHSSVSLEEKDGEHFFRFNKDVSFLNKAKIVKALENIPSGAKVTFDLTKMEFIDHDIKEMLTEFRKGAPLRDIDVKWMGASGELVEQIEQNGS